MTMAATEVTIYCEQQATVTVEVPDEVLALPYDERTRQVTNLTLRALDKSGGAEWTTTIGWIEYG